MDLAIGLAHANLQDATRCHRLDGVQEQIHEELLQQRGLALHHNLALRKRRLRFDLVQLGMISHQGQRLLDQRDQTDEDRQARRGMVGVS